MCILKSSKLMHRTINCLCHLFSVPSSGTPTSVVVTNIGTTSLTFTWSAVSCEDAHGSVDSYTYNLTAPVVTGDTGFTSKSVSNLIPCTNYNFQVAAVRDETVGPFSPKIVATTKQTGKI